MNIDELCGSALGSVWQSCAGQCAAFQQCGSVRQCAIVRAAVCGSVRQCAIVRAAVCGRLIH
jgi:hypothetical protein